jgi:hypothetical protein
MANFFKRIGRAVSRSAAYVAPTAGALSLGTAGAAGGTAIAAALAQFGGSRNASAVKARRLRAIITGGAVTGGTAAMNLITGTGLSTGWISALLGNSNETPDTAKGEAGAPTGGAKGSAAENASLWQMIGMESGQNALDQLGGGAPGQQPGRNVLAEQGTSANQGRKALLTWVLLGGAALLAVSIIRR